MKTLLIAQRELRGYLNNPLGYFILAILLLVDGLLFNGFAMGGQKLSYQVLFEFFYFSSGTTMVASIFISMRLFAEERQMGTLALLQTSPTSEVEWVIGKYLGAYLFLLLLLALSAYMPLLILVNGKVTAGHLLAGYLGLALLGAACLAMGVFASSIAPNQVVAAVIAACLIVSLLVLWMLSSKVEGSLGDFLNYLSLWDKHFRPFSRGIIQGSAILYYVSLVYVFLLAAIYVLRGRRWSGA